MRIPHGLGPLLLRGLLPHPDVDPAVAVVHDEGVCGYEVGLKEGPGLDLGDPEGAVLVAAPVQFDILAGSRVLFLVTVFGACFQTLKAANEVAKVTIPLLLLNFVRHCSA